MTPLDQSATTLLPLLLRARGKLSALAAPKAEKLSDRIFVLLEQMVDVAEDVELYCDKWRTPSDMETLAADIRLAIKEYNS
jgi:hypothetical protein